MNRNKIRGLLKLRSRADNRNGVEWQKEGAHVWQEYFAGWCLVLCAVDSAGGHGLAGENKS